MSPRNVEQLFMVLQCDFINIYLKEDLKDFILINITDVERKEKFPKISI